METDMVQRQKWFVMSPARTVGALVHNQANPDWFV